jgi:ubiquinone/menaquinone biosynthesis C-methylase UbiE
MSERISRFVQSMHVQAHDRVLEIGCGNGVAATLICRMLDGGDYVAVDRSQKMVDAASKRNAAFIESGVARFVCAPLESLDLGSERFDKILAMRVRIFHADPQRARELAQRWLSPGGKLFVEYDEPARK